MNVSDAGLRIKFIFWIFFSSEELVGSTANENSEERGMDNLLSPDKWVGMGRQEWSGS